MAAQHTTSDYIKYVAASFLPRYRYMRLDGLASYLPWHEQVYIRASATSAKFTVIKRLNEARYCVSADAA